MLICVKKRSIWQLKKFEKWSWHKASRALFVRGQDEARHTVFPPNPIEVCQEGGMSASYHEMTIDFGERDVETPLYPARFYEGIVGTIRHIVSRCGGTSPKYIVPTAQLGHVQNHGGLFFLRRRHCEHAGKYKFGR